MALGLVLAVALVVSGALFLRPAPIAKWVDDDPGSSGGPSAPAPPPVLAAVPDNAPMPTAAGVHAAIDGLVAGADLGFNLSVRDVVTGDELYERGADVGTVPASTTKLVTAAAVLAARGPAHRIPTRVVAGATPGEVVIIGGGDPTLAAGAKGAYAGAARIDQLAAQVQKALGGADVTKVTVDVSLFEGAVEGPGWDDDIFPNGCSAAITPLMIDGGRINQKAGSCVPRHSKPDITAGQAFAKALGLPSDVIKAVRVGTAPASSGTPAKNTSSQSPSAAPPGPGTELGRVQSPPVIRLVDIMLSDSDNTVAEALARQVALARNQPASFAGAAEAMEGILAEVGLDVTQLEFADGSGLSRQNRISPAFLTDLLIRAGNGSRPELSGLFSGLPVAAWSGSLANRYTGSEASASASGMGVVRAKTGTLTEVYSLSGVVTTADGRTLAFAVMTDSGPKGSWLAEPEIDKIVAKLASCGCR
ncbi:MAG TPA: D-alanyl-D-alanine carboxypeptidase/D-alanyl-D-alanine-endopeptidase [Micromonosporaceae bacterium]|nr:D-alanyl-D-alanine carboxypeptidase/D-alanyl-D-alanine-endopeptidase [Micromonosporaceae bacterium]